MKRAMREVMEREDAANSGAPGHAARVDEKTPAAAGA